jgi:hypothetical protein
MRTVHRETATCGAECFLSLLKSDKGALPMEALYNTPDDMDCSYTAWSALLRTAFRSGKERSFAEFMYHQKIDFKYERYVLPIGTTISIPDFWFPRWHTFVEVKGMWAIGGPAKLQALAVKYPNMRLLLLSTHIGWDYDKRCK